MSVDSIWAGRCRGQQGDPFDARVLVSIPLYYMPENHYDAAVMFLERGVLPGGKEEYLKVLKGKDILQVLLNDLGFL